MEGAAPSAPFGETAATARRPPDPGSLRITSRPDVSQRGRTATKPFYRSRGNRENEWRRRSLSPFTPFSPVKSQEFEIVAKKHDP
jgi:hypothetical protein